MTSAGWHANQFSPMGRRRKRPLCWAVVISALGHLLALMAGGEATPAPSTLPAVHVRLLQRTVPKPTQGRPTADNHARVSLDRAVPPVAPITESAQPPTPASEASFLPPSSLEQVALPKSGPAIEALDDMPSTGAAINLRLFIDEEGVVQRVEPLAFAPDDEVAVRQLQEVFMATSFLPGQRQGQSVRSYLDIEITPNPLH